jgi:hypothetical protein
MKAEKLERRISHKILLVIVKYIPHFIALFYAIYNLLAIVGIDVIVFGYFVHVSLLPWILMYILSIALKYCYVHRLPLYYILGSELLTTLDYLLDYSIEESTILMINGLLIITIIFGYTYYYKNYVK